MNKGENDGGMCEGLLRVRDELESLIGMSKLQEFREGIEPLELVERNLGSEGEVFLETGIDGPLGRAELIDQEIAKNRKEDIRVDLRKGILQPLELLLRDGTAVVGMDIVKGTSIGLLLKGHEE